MFLIFYCIFLTWLTPCASIFSSYPPFNVPVLIPPFNLWSDSILWFRLPGLLWYQLMSSWCLILCIYTYLHNRSFTYSYIHNIMLPSVYSACHHIMVPPNECFRHFNMFWRKKNNIFWIQPAYYPVSTCLKNPPLHVNTRLKPFRCERTGILRTYVLNP